MQTVIIGKGGFGREVAEAYNSICNMYNERKALFYTDVPPFERDIDVLDFKEHRIIIAVGDPKKRECLHNGYRLFRNYNFSDPSAIIGNCKIGDGYVIMQNCVITTNVTIGIACHLNIGTVIGHDCNIGDFLTTAPGVKIAGNCRIGNRVYIGQNASIRQGVKICDDVVIGQGASVVKDITEPGVYVGVPAKKLTKNEGR